MNNRLMITFGVILAAFLALNSTVYVVKQTERAVKLRFGQIVDDDIQPGLGFKVPFMDQVRKFDARVLTLDAQPASFYTVEKKRLIVDAYAKWKISDVGAYYRATGGDESIGHDRLANRVNDGLRNQFGTRTLHEVVSGQRDELMQNITQELNLTVANDLGIEVIDVRVKRIDLPSEVSDPVFRRMTAEREKEARELRSKGQEQSEKIRADADRQSTIIEANAYRDAEKLRGEGDAKATVIYAAAYGKNPEFYSFFRSLNAYKSAFANKGDIMLVDPDSDFFRYFKDQQGK